MRAIWYNGQVYTGEETLRQAFLVEDGVFLAVGSDAVIRALADDDTVCSDLGGRFVCPGFNDSHMHLLNLGQSLNAAQLAQHTDSLSGMLSYLRDYAAEVPIMLTRACGHCCVVNSRVLEIAGITGDTPSPEGGNIGKENGVPDGRLYINMRSYHGQGVRAAAYSPDEGASWRSLWLDNQLPDPVCQGSVLFADGVLYFCNAADSRERRRLTLRKSLDGGKTWSAGTVIAPGPAAYSDLTELKDGRLACLYESGEKDAYEGIFLTLLEKNEIQ